MRGDPVINFTFLPPEWPLALAPTPKAADRAAPGASDALFAALQHHARAGAL